MTEQKNKRSRPWHKEPWPWVLIALPAVMIVISVFGLIWPAINTEDTLVTDDYYKEGKNIYLEIARDDTAFKRHISAQVYVQPNRDGAMVIARGDYDTTVPLRLLFIHPTRKQYDQTVTLTQSPSNPLQYTATLAQPLPMTNNWIIRLEDNNHQWRIESRWIVSQGNSVTLMPLHPNAPSPAKDTP